MAYEGNYGNGIPDCPNKYTVDNIEKWFMVEEDEIEICNECKNLMYSNGIMTCKYLNRLKGGRK